MLSMNHGLGCWAPVRDVVPSRIKGILGAKSNFEIGVKCFVKPFFLFLVGRGVDLIDKMFNSVHHSYHA